MTFEEASHALMKDLKTRLAELHGHFDAQNVDWHKLHLPLAKLVSEETQKSLVSPEVVEVRPKELECDVVRYQNNKEKWVALVGLLNGHPYEIFTGLQDEDEGIMLPKSVTKGKIIKTPCTTCKGKGKVRRTNRVLVKVPAGVNDGQSVRVRGAGNVGSGGAPAGDLLAEVHIRPHKLFRRRDFDVYCEVPISFAQAALGAEIEVPTLDGKVTYTIPEGTQTGREFVLRGKGIPQVNNPKLRGDHHFTVVVETPTRLTSEQKELLRQFDGTVSKNVTPKRKGFQDVLNDFFK